MALRPRMVAMDGELTMIMMMMMMKLTMIIMKMMLLMMMLIVMMMMTMMMMMMMMIDSSLGKAGEAIRAVWAKRVTQPHVTLAGEEFLSSSL